ncbi:signal transduction histidine-protein kinase BaeS [Lachnospiraceae bacterium]|jgi:signal transduction histidine kinase|nr:signal transduction histidine-protein kinase BaeS [Lachnospiraceae bacterium]
MKCFIAVTICLYLAACISLCCIFAAGPQDKINNTEANDIIFTVRKYWPDAERAVSMMQGYGTDYLVTDAEGRTVAVSSPGLNTDYVYDYIHKDYSVDILEDGKVLGRIIFINNGEDDFKRKVGVWALAFLAIFLLKDILAVFYLRKHIFDPVKRMNDFAGQIARGNLDIPVDCSASFGAFSESFDIMREELLYARKGEQEADKRRREVIASISHDIKNPVASIQAIAEYQSLTTGSDELRREFETITQKTNQINGMIHNLHTSMLDDLERLEVRPKELGSSAIGEALRQADFRKRIKDFEIPECLVMADQVRFMQVADNIISNSYKYADTQIEVCSWFEDECLCISIKDFGKGVKKEEEIFLTQKYFRGQNAKEKEGSGMGMYIAEYLVKGMGGRLLCRSEENAWFEVRIWLALAA